jgi:hypothetical protein
VIGGLPSFGNNYSMPAIIEAVSEMWDKPNQFALAAALCDEIAALPKVSITENADGAAAVEIVDAVSLESLLLTPDVVSGIVGLPNMVTISSWMKPDSSGSSESYVPRDCLGALYSGMSVVYAGNGYSAIFQTRTGPNKSRPGATPAVDQSASAVDTPAEAQNAMSDFLDTLHNCAGKDFTCTRIQVTWKLGCPADAGDGITTLESTQQGGGLVIDRALAVKGNVLVEVQAQDRKPLSDEVKKIMDRLLDRIGRQTS